MNDQSLVKRSSAIETTTKHSSGDSALLKLLRTTAVTMGKEFREDEVQLWKELLADQPQAGLEWAFREHIRTSKFFPKPAEIIELVSSWKAKITDAAKQRAAEESTKEFNRRLAEEQATPEYQKAKADLADFCKRMDEQLGFKTNERDELKAQARLTEQRRSSK